MPAKEYKANSYIYTEGAALDAILLIASGSVKASFSGGSMVLKKGDAIGVLDIAYDVHSVVYQAIEDVTVLVFAINGKDSVRNLVANNADIARMLFNSSIAQANTVFASYLSTKSSCKDLFDKTIAYYNEYSKICASNHVTPRSIPQLDDLRELTIADDLGAWIPEFYKGFREADSEFRAKISEQTGFLPGFLFKSSYDCHNVYPICDYMNEYKEESSLVILNENELDLYGLCSNLLRRIPPDSADYKRVSEILTELEKYATDLPGIDAEFAAKRFEAAKKLADSVQIAENATSEANSYDAELAGSLDRILEYGAIDDELATNFRRLITKYKKAVDKAATDDESRKLRMDLTTAFNKIYAKTFRVSLNDNHIPRILKMFFKFGYVDEELAGMANASYLYSIADEYEGDETYGFYTLYEWLRAIYDLKKEPSRNEFDVDFLAHIHELKVSGKIPASMEQSLINDPDARLSYELENVFPVVNKVTFGRLSAFCPVFGEHNVIKPLNMCLVGVDELVDAIRKVDTIDYGAFYRETVYSNDAVGISSEFINVKILPNVILFPNIGTRGVMWQEIEGRKRTTPARFMLSVFHIEDLATTFTRLVGEYRWEMCKRVQGARWNDVSDRSLTSEYFDYIQFYRKNSELSNDAKEKIKNGLVKAKNSFKEMFVRDYITWVLYEGNGSPRLNKVVRSIMCTYCPFPLSLRQKIGGNPMFKEYIEHYEVKMNQRLHRFDNVLQRFKNANIPIPNELLVQRNFIEGK